MTNLESYLLLDVIATLEDLPRLLVDEKERRRMSWRTISAATGVAQSHLWDIAKGVQQPTVPIVIRVLRWIAEGDE